MAQYFDKNASVEDYKLHEKRMIVPFSVVHNATPANKTNSNDLPAAMVLDLQGQLAADAIDSGCNFTTPNDASGVFGVLMYHLGTVNKLLDVGIVNLSSGTASVARSGASSSGVTASGNIAVSVTWSGNLATTDLSANMVFEYNVVKA
jgi:hypothetical protein